MTVTVCALPTDDSAARHRTTITVAIPGVASVDTEERNDIHSAYFYNCTTGKISTASSVGFILRSRQTPPVNASRHAQAHARRQLLLVGRRAKIASRLKTAQCLQRIHKQRQQLESLRLKASIDYTICAANLRRNLRLQLFAQSCAATVQRAKNLALQHRLKRCAELKRAFSDTFADLLGALEADVPAVEAEQSVAGMRRCLSADAALPPSTVQSAQPLALPSSHLTDLVAVFGPDNLPTVTRASLGELSLDTIISHSQIRHDLLFDPDIEFRQNDEGERWELKKQRSDSFWADIERDVSGQNSADGRPLYARLPVLVHEIKEILLELVATDDIRATVATHLDVALIAQQMHHGVFNPAGMFAFLSVTMKDHCAPIRDGMVHSLTRLAEEGKFVQAMRLAFEILEYMKLDVANDQLRRLRPYFVENAVQYEWDQFKVQLREKTVQLKNTLQWLRASFHSHTAGQVADPLLHYAFMELVAGIDDKNDEYERSLPETWRLDTDRLVTFHNDWQDISIMACLLMRFRQVCGARCTDALVEKARQDMLVLLNDTDTTMSHIALYISGQAESLAGRKFTQQEHATVFALVNQTLSPDSVVFAVVDKHVRRQITGYLQTHKLDKPEQLRKVGLCEVEGSLTLLAKKMSTAITHNIAVYAKVYTQILDTLR